MRIYHLRHFPGCFLTSILRCWHGQVYQANASVVKLRQRQAFIQTLEELFLPLDVPRKQILYTEPYIEACIDLVHRL